jgi:hypothetical protein
VGRDEETLEVKKHTIYYIDAKLNPSKILLVPIFNKICKKNGK